MSESERLRELAANVREAADILAADGHHKEANKALRTAMDIIASAERMEREGLQGGNRHGNKGEMVSTAARLRISEATGGEDGPDPLVLAANAAGYTLRSLGEAVGVSHAMLSQARSGDKALREDIALHVQKLTGFKATRKNWPKGWARPRK